MINRSCCPTTDFAEVRIRASVAFSLAAPVVPLCTDIATMITGSRICIRGRFFLQAPPLWQPKQPKFEI